ncbi:MAG: succinylglutamate desuccinylase/aspartoacylase family protein [Bdellovibrionota bacterium]|nr:succinylglutamate desuccinylase/aspartoacylase family protein [Bdellovibrionota bacterium]
MKKFQKKLIPIRTLANGDQQNIEVLTIKGQEGGLKVHIQASVHGAEIQGNAVIYELLKILRERDFKGEFVLIPCANPIGINTKSGTTTQGRFNPITGDNWNRNYVDLSGLPLEETNFDVQNFVDDMIKKGFDLDLIKDHFKTLIKKAYDFYWENFLKRKGPSDNKFLNITLQKLATQADIVLDLHTGPKATRYLYAGEFEKASAKHFLTPFSLIIPNKFAGAMDEATFMPWLTLEKEFQKRGQSHSFGFESYTLELGSEETINEQEAKKDAARIVNYLNFKGLSLSDPPAPETPTQHYCLLKDYKTIYSPKAGLVEFLKGPGEGFQKGDVLASFLNLRGIDSLEKIEEAKTSLVAKEDGFVITHSTTCVIHEGMELFQVLTNPKPY